MITIKDLIEKMSSYPEDSEIRIIGSNDPIVHMHNISYSPIGSEEYNNILLITDHFPIGYCIKCGTYAFDSFVPDYKGFCPVCDEDLFAFEVSELDEYDANRFSGNHTCE